MAMKETGEGPELSQISATHGPQGSVVAAPKSAEGKTLLPGESFTFGRRLPGKSRFPALLGIIGPPRPPSREEPRFIFYDEAAPVSDTAFKHLTT